MPGRTIQPRVKGRALLLLLLAWGAHAGVYKWTDSQGRVHYSDTPPPRQEVQSLRTDKTNDAAAAAERRALSDRLTESELSRKHAREAEDKRKAEEEAARKRAQNCQRARERLTLLQQNIPITRVDAQGQRYTMTDAERAAAALEAQRHIDEHCK